MHQSDFIIVGQGLAGTSLAWQLHFRGATVLLIDRDDASTASKIAAGLITPITGQRFVKSWKFEELWQSALQFYQRVEHLTGAKFFKVNSQVRLFASQSEQSSLHDSQQATPPLNPAWFDVEHGGFQMDSSAQLDVSTYLHVSRAFFNELNSVLVADIDMNSDIKVDSEVELPRHSARASKLIFCRGFADRENPWFSQVAFDPTRGEILTVRIPGLEETRIVNRGVWLAPLGDEFFRAGATYDWNDLTSGPTQEGRDEIVRRLESFLKLPFEVVDHHAAVRPIVMGRHPICGLHPDIPQLGIFNGLGSKGSLQAPMIAAQMASHLIDGAPLDEEIDFVRRFPNLSTSARDTDQKRRPRLTELAHQTIRENIRLGETVVDATAGNGHDTLFLSEIVGEQGRVIAIDVQDEAIQRTARHVENAGVRNVRLVTSCHSELARIVDESDHRRVAAIMFNLGYLPKGDKSVITQTATSMLAIQAALELVRRDGIVSVLAYPGHAGGDTETTAVIDFVNSLDSEQFEVRTTKAKNNPTSPILIQAIRKR